MGLYGWCGGANPLRSPGKKKLVGLDFRIDISNIIHNCSPLDLFLRCCAKDCDCVHLKHSCSNRWWVNDGYKLEGLEKGKKMKQVGSWEQPMILCHQDWPSVDRWPIEEMDVRISQLHAEGGKGFARKGLGTLDAWLRQPRETERYLKQRWKIIRWKLFLGTCAIVSNRRVYRVCLQISMLCSRIQ